MHTHPIPDNKAPRHKLLCWRLHQPRLEKSLNPQARPERAVIPRVQRDYQHCPIPQSLGPGLSRDGAQLRTRCQDRTVLPMSSHQCCSSARQEQPGRIPIRIPPPHGPEASDPHHCSRSVLGWAGFSLAAVPTGRCWKGVGVQPHAPAGAGGAHICAASCLPWDLLSAEADGCREAVSRGADTGVSTIPPETDSLSAPTTLQPRRNVLG